MQYIIIAVLIGIAVGLFFAYMIVEITMRNEPYRKEAEKFKAIRKNFEQPNKTDAAFLKDNFGVQPKQLPNCRCADPNQCDTWCHAKAMFAKHHG